MNLEEGKEPRLSTRRWFSVPVLVPEAFFSLQVVLLFTGIGVKVFLALGVPHGLSSLTG